MKYTSLHTIPLGSRKINKPFLTNLIPSFCREVAHDNGGYIAVVVIFPEGKNVLSFEKMWDNISAAWKERLLPVYSLVSNGVFGSYFVVYLRQESRVEFIEPAAKRP